MYYIVLDMWNYVLCAIFTVYCACITYFKFTNGVCYSKKILNGKTALITGGNKG